MKPMQLGNFKTHALILFSLFTLLFVYSLFNKNNHLSKHTSLSEIKNKTTEYTDKNIKTSDIPKNSENNSVTSSTRLKRFIIFDGSGVVKLVIGTSFPVIMADKMRSLSYFYNFQMQYVPPPIPLYWWSFYNTSTFPARNYKKQKRSTETLAHYDTSRSMLYKFIEEFFQKSGYSGRKCLLRTICEISRTPLKESSELVQLYNSAYDIVEDLGRNIYHTLINAIFVPSYSNIHERYINARDAGAKGANCSKMFGECYIMEQFFKQFTLLI